MALAISYFPNDLQSLQDDLIYTVINSVAFADPTTYPNYKYIGDVYVDGVLVATIKKVPNPVTGYGVFDVSQTVRNYLDTQFSPTFGALVAQSLGDVDFSLTVTMHFGEEYSDTEFLNLEIDDDRTFFNNYNGRGDPGAPLLFFFQDQVASNRDTTASVLLTSRFELITYFPTTATPVSVVVTPSGGGSGFTTSFTPTAFEMQVLNLAPANLNVLHAGTITAGTNSYTVQIGSQTYTFRLICEALYTPVNIYFLNKFGGFENKLFPKVSRYSVSITPSEFKKLRYTIDNSGFPQYSNTNMVFNEARSVYSKQYFEKRTLNTDFLTDTEYSWLADLFLSPMVFMEFSNNDIVPCVITATDYEIHKQVNDDLTSLTIDIEFGQGLNSQYR